MAKPLDTLGLSIISTSIKQRHGHRGNTAEEQQNNILHSTYAETLLPTYA